MRTENVDTIVRAMLAFDPMGQAQQQQLLRKAVNALGSFGGHNFYAADEHSREFITGGPAPFDLTVKVRNRHLDEKSDEPAGWVKLMVTDDGPTKPTFLFMSIYAGSEADMASVEWGVGQALLPRLIDASSPHWAFMNCKLSDDEDYRIFPREASKPGGLLPTSLPPAFYIDTARLSEPSQVSWLEGLPARRVDAGHKAVIFADNGLNRTAPADFLKALEAAPMEPIAFIPPQLPQSKAQK
jgi:hypothetical protein